MAQRRQCLVLAQSFTFAFLAALGIALNSDRVLVSAHLIAAIARLKSDPLRDLVYPGELLGTIERGRHSAFTSPLEPSRLMSSEVFW